MIRQLLWLLGGRIVSALLQFASFVLLARWAGPSDFGLTAAVTSFVVVPQSVLDFGISTAVLKARAAGGRESFVRGALALSNRISLLFGLVFAAALVGLGATWDPRLMCLVPLAVWASAEKNSDTWVSVAIADGDTRINGLNYAARRGILLVTFVLLWYSLSIPAILAFSVASAIGGLCAAGVSQAVIGKRLRHGRSKVSLREALRETRSFWAHSVATQVRNSDATIVAVLASTLEAGYFAVGSRLSGPLRMIPTSLAPILLANVAKHGFGRVVRQQLVWTMVLMSTLYVGLAATAPWYIPLLLGEEYAPSVVPVQIVCLSLIFGSAASLLSAVLQGMGRQRAVAFVSMATSAVVLVGLVGLTIVGGAVGAAFALGVSFLFQSVSLFAVFVVQGRRPSSIGALPTESPLAAKGV